MPLVSARGEDIEIFAIAAFENLSLDVFVLLFCLHLGFVNVSLVRNRHLPNTSCFIKVQHHGVCKKIKNKIKKTELTNKKPYKKPCFIGFRPLLKLESMINAHCWLLQIHYG